MSDAKELLRRARSIRAFDSADKTTVVGRDGTAREFHGPSALLVREILRAVVQPVTMDRVLEYLSSVAAGVAESRPAIDEAVRILCEAGVVIASTAKSAASAREVPLPFVQGRLVLGISGAVAAAHTPVLIERLVFRGFDVRVAMTKAAKKFVSPTALRALTHRRVHSNLWAGTEDAPVPHIDLAQWAEVVLIAPASATTLSRMAAGDFSDLVSAVALSTRAPVVLAPSMNTAMYDSPSVSRNLDQLIDDGFHVLHSSLGVEVADAPVDRRPIFGSWPTPEDIAASTEHVWRTVRQRLSNVSDGAASAETWEAIYRDVPAAKLPFHSDRLDDDIRAVLERIPRPATLWDVGTGLGTVAREVASLGFEVTATDISSRAIAKAQEGAESRIRFAADDVRRSVVEGQFDVIVDRGCFHTLDPKGAAAYASTMRARTHAGSKLVLKIHREDEPGEWRTTRYRLADLERLFGPHFRTIGWNASELQGNGATARAWLAVFERT